MPHSSIHLPLKTEYPIKDRLYWNFLYLIPFFIGSIAIARDSFKWVAVYIGIAVFFLLIIQFHFACKNFMHSIWSKGCIKCTMLPGLPEPLKDRPDSYLSLKKMIVVLGVLSVILFPVYWLVRDTLLLGAYVIAWALFFFTLRRYECTGCINFERSMNDVTTETRNNFQKKGCEKGFKENLDKSIEIGFEKNLEKNLEKKFKAKDNLSATETRNNFQKKGCDILDLSEEEVWISGDDRCVFLNMKHEFKDFLYWNFVTLTLLLSAGFAIGIRSTGWLIAYIFVVFFHFNILEQRFFCTHCPYYSRDGEKFRCMMNWGWPKHFRPRPCPPGKFDIAITTLGFIIVIFFPIPWLLKEPFLLGAYSVSILLFLLTIWKYECSHCIYFGCPFNRVPAETKKEFEESRKI